MYSSKGFIKTLFYFLSDNTKFHKSDRLFCVSKEINLWASFITGNRKEAIFILPGLEGHSNRPYIQQTAKWFSGLGHPIILFNYRGNPPKPNLDKSAIYHAGLVEDIKAVLDKAEKEWQLKNFHFIGYSTGGSFALNYLNQFPNDNRILKSVLISSPLNFQKCSRNMDKPENSFFRFHLLRTLNKKSKQILGKEYWSFLKFENYAVAKTMGFRNSTEYYEKHSPHNFIHSVKKPFLVFNSIFDPLLSKECLTLAKSLDESSRFYTGGHIYVDGKMDRVLKEIEEYFNEIAPTNNHDMTEK